MEATDGRLSDLKQGSETKRTRQSQVRNVFADANVPAVILANVNGKRIRAENYTCAHITVSEEHPVEK
jgi:hypothetical protein